MYAGATEGLAAGALFGLHIWPFLPTGTLASRSGAIMAAAQQFEAKVSGRGGHAGMPPVRSAQPLASWCSCRKGAFRYTLDHMRRCLWTQSCRLLPSWERCRCCAC